MINKDEFDGNLVYGGKVFHQKTGRANIIVKKKYPHLEFMDCKGGIYNPSKVYFQHLDRCPVCKNKKFTRLLEKEGLRIDQCQKCSFGFQNPRFRSEHLSKLYAQEYSLNASYKSTAQNELDDIKFRYALQEIKKIRKSIQSVLDIGAGNLHFLQVCRRHNIEELYGIEPGSTLNKGEHSFNIITEFSDEVPMTLNNLSLISMWDTLEHIHNFKKLLESCYRALNKNGLLLIMVPNLRSLASRLIREKSPSFCIYHLNYFTEASLQQSLQNAGFSVVKKETVISEIDNCRNMLEFNEPYFSAPKNDKAFSWLTPSYIHKNMLGSRLFFISQKS